MLRLALSSLLLLGACSPCTQTCDLMADYAEECGYTVTSQAVDQCKADQRDPTVDRATCRQANDADALREAWSCDDVGDYFSQD